MRVCSRLVSPVTLRYLSMRSRRARLDQFGQLVPFGLHKVQVAGTERQPKDQFVENSRVFCGSVTPLDKLRTKSPLRTRSGRSISSLMSFSGMAVFSFQFSVFRLPFSCVWWLDSFR